MKKTLLLFVVIGIVSCSKKDWTCSCTSDIDGSHVETSNYKLTESDAISSCESRDSEPEISCVLKEK